MVAESCIALEQAKPNIPESSHVSQYLRQTSTLFNHVDLLSPHLHRFPAASQTAWLHQSPLVDVNILHTISVIVLFLFRIILQISKIVMLYPGCKEYI